MKALLAALACVAVGALSLAGAAQTDAPGCVTRAEYRAVHKGDKMRRVHRIFDTDGRRLSIVWYGGYGGQVHRYRACRPGSSVVAQFEKKPGGVWRLIAKSAVWA
jgi:hypothetical protein